MKRTIGTIAVASALSLVLFACSSSHKDEPQGTTSSDLLNCSPGYPECSFDSGRKVCYCVEPTPVCSGVPSLGLDYFVQAWAVVPFDGTCAPIRGLGGYWAEIWTVTPPPGVSVPNGVPNDVGEASPDCKDVFTSAGTCCTYVWWPTNLGTSLAQAGQDNTVVCTKDTEKMEAIIGGGITQCPVDDGGTCHGGGMCSTCYGNYP